MKILSIIIHGGIHIQCFNKIKILLFLVLSFSLCSCDVGHNLTFEGQTHPFVYLKTDMGTIRVNCMYFKGLYYLMYEVEGGCTVNLDSLKLQVNDDNLVVNYYPPYKNSSTYNLHKNESISFRLVFNRKDPSKGIVNPLVLSILPSDFITYNGQRITNDTLQVELKEGLKGYR